MLIRPPLFRFLTLAAALLGANHHLHAQTVSLPQKAAEGTSWTLGVAVLSVPSYFGADSQRVLVLPAVTARSEEGWFITGRGDAGWNFSKDNQLEYGVMLSPQLARNESADPALKGMGDIKLRPELGGFVNYRPIRGLNLQAAVRAGSGNDQKGAILSLAAGTVIPVSKSMVLAGSVGLAFTNQAYAQSFFGVNSAQSASSGYAVYQPRAGLADVNLTLALVGQLTPRWNYTAGINAARLLGDYKNSPLTQKANQAAFFSSVSYKF